MTLHLYSSLGREQREFRTVVPGIVRMYVCGVTPYDVTHLGHAFSYVQFDTLRRYLTFLGHEVHYVQNITDIDDDMIMVSKRQGGRSIAEIRDENDAIFRDDLDRMNVLRPWHYPKATEHILEIIETTRRILEAGCGYEADGDVFFEAEQFPRYGQLNGVTIAELAKRENPESKREYKKRGPLDFLLWQQVDPGDPSWDSPWGPGRPGWSIECTAMSSAHLGEQIDIHGGGRDLIFPHHENEIAQAESAFGVAPFCGFWMHNGMLKLDGVKMSKSLGNLVLARNLMKDHEPDQLRLCLLTDHYRSDPDYREGGLDEFAPVYERLKIAGSTPVPPFPGEPAPLELGVRERLDDDFDTPGAIALLDHAAQRIISGHSEPSEQPALRKMLGILGVAFAGARGPANGDFSALEKA